MKFSISKWLGILKCGIDDEEKKRKVSLDYLNANCWIEYKIHTLVFVFVSCRTEPSEDVEFIVAFDKAASDSKSDTSSL